MEIKDIDVQLFAEFLDPAKAHLAPGASLTDVPLENAEEVAIEWGPFATIEHFYWLKEALRIFTWPTNALAAKVAKSYVEGKEPNQPAFIIEGQPFYGRWRMVAVRERKQETANPDAPNYFIGVTLRKGFLQAFDWTEVRMAEGWTSPGNASVVTTPAADGGDEVSNTTTDDPEQVLMLRLANVDPTRMFDVAKSINAAVTGTLTIEGIAHGTDWHFIVAQPQRQQDGSGTIEFMVAKPQFTINAFQDNNTSREVNVGYLWQVPKALAQTIITAWDAGAGRSASASYGKDARLVDIVLTAVVGRANLTTPWRQQNCNTWVRYHFAWGYTEAQVYTDATPGPESGFLFDHSSAIGTTEDGKIIRSRTDSVNIRGDALFDVVIIETSFDNVDAADVYTEYPDFSITLWTGTKITRRVDHGYKIGLANLELLKAVYDSATTAVTGEIVPAVGKSVDFRVTRQDECSFDFIAQIVAQSAAIEKATGNDVDLAADTSVPAATTAGVIELVRSVKGATDAELLTIAAKHQAAIRKTVSMRLDAREDELSDVTIGERRVRTTEGTKVIGDHTLYVGANADAILTTGLTGVVLRSANVNYGDGGEASYSILVKPLTTYSGSFVSAFGSNDHYIQVGINQTSVPAMTGTMPLSQSIGEGDNGKFNYVLVSRDITAVTVDTADDGVGTGGIKTESSAGINIAEASLPVPSASRLVDDEVDVQATEEGRANFRRSKRTMQETEINVVHGVKGETITEEIHRNAADTDATITGLSAAPTANGQRVVFEAVLDDKKNVVFRKGVHQKVEQTQQLIGGTYFEKETIDLSVNDVTRDAADLQQWTSVEEGKSILFQARLDPDGSIDWDRRTREKQARNTLAVTLTIARLAPSLDRYGYYDTGTWFHGIKLVDMVNYDLDITPSPGADEYGYIEEIRRDPVDGTFSGKKVLRNYYGTVTVTSAPATPKNITDESPSSTAPNSYMRRWIETDGTGGQYREINADFEELFTDDYAKAINFCAAVAPASPGFFEFPQYVFISGTPYWFARKMTRINFGAWVTASGDITPTP